MKGVVLAGCPTAVLVDVSHEVPRFDVSAGAFMVFAGTRHFGGGSVHLAVVDPGVGSTRRRLIVQAGGRYYIGPDNGLFAIVIDEVGVQAVHELAPRPHGAPTFEGRDGFAAAAAALASGVPIDSLGPATDPPLGLPDTGPRVLWTDGFGNLVTNLKPPPPRPLPACSSTTTTSSPPPRLRRGRGRARLSCMCGVSATSSSGSASPGPTSCRGRGPACGSTRSRKALLNRLGWFSPSCFLA